jgi:hypothetical protein
VLLEPIGRYGGRAIRRRVDHLTPFEIHHSNRSLRLSSRNLALQPPKDGVVASWRAKTLHQPFSRLSASAMPEKLNEFGAAPRSPGGWRENVRRSLDKCPALAFAISASPAA